MRIRSYRGRPVDNELADILSIAGHELSQPLAVAIGAAQLLEPDEADERRQFIHTMLVRNLRQLQQLVDDFEVMGNPELLSDVDVDPMARRLEPLLVAGILENSTRDFAIAFPHCRIDVSCDPDLRAMVDSSRFRQVLSNLLTNAEKFGTPGEPITVRGRRENGDVLVSVQNKGLGFPQEEAEKIFDKSIRLGGVVRGRGWGLYVAKAIIHAHSGSLWAKSEPGRGATFFIRVPALD